jgi:NAD(P)-dependent dehydrogenase (short-subunit alcohol dehydrogenase family)
MRRAVIVVGPPGQRRERRSREGVRDHCHEEVVRIETEAARDEGRRLPAGLPEARDAFGIQRRVRGDESQPGPGDLDDRLSSDLGGFDVLTAAGDIADAAFIDTIMATAGGRVDGLANVAGIMDGFLPPAEVDDATWDRVFGVNLTGPMRLTRAVLPGMIAAGGGAIVNVASEAALRASASGAAYTASKHAIAGYTKSVAFFYGPQGIRANAVAPGLPSDGGWSTV